MPNEEPNEDNNRGQRSRAKGEGLEEAITIQSELGESTKARLTNRGGRDFKKTKQQQRLDQQRQWANNLLLLLAFLVLASTLLVFLVAGIGYAWEMPAEIMISYFASVVAEVIGVVIVAVRYIFSEDGLD